MADIERGYPLGQARESDDNLELQPLRTSSTTDDDHEDETLNAYDEKPLSQPDSIFASLRTGEQRFWDRLRGKGRRVPGWGESFKNVLFSSWLNILLPVVPVAWVSHFIGKDWSPKITFRLCLWAIIPLAKLFDWGAEQMTLYLGKALGDLLTITMNNAVEAVLAIILLLKCELRLLQATIIGVMILHLLLVPGAAFLSGGAHIWEQELHPNATQLNHSLLALGVLAILLPTAFFASLDRGAQSLATNGIAQYSGELLTDSTRGNVLKMSRGLAVLLLIVYILSRVYLHNPPEVENENPTKAAMDATEKHKHQRHSLDEEDPKINPWACIILIVITVGIMAVTAEFLVSTIEGVRETTDIQEEWFGLILLPLVSFAPDGLIALVHSARKIISHMLGRKTIEPSPLAKALSIDLSIQFTLFWTPMLVLIGWWTGKPMHLLFDYFELAIILGSCFLVNYVTADLKTNWVEGLIMITFYVMIALCTWFYAGQPELEAMLTCAGSVAQALAEESGGEGGGEQGGEVVELAKRTLIAVLR